MGVHLTGREEWLQPILAANGLLTPPASKVPIPEISEADFQAEIIALAKQLGWWAYHPKYSYKSKLGYPDLTLIRDRIIWAELKTETGQLTAAQEDVIERIQKAGGTVYVWRPSMRAEILEVLK